ncbi:hypothetical protein P154DRAFT_543874 [Amniculicola lignicola CBS 123094]|uniref:DUF6314 domain-containing protein n=1 Tax=Amniculicola lignicola CBS 123094 TaxID=1392246 RepID=A0A6A5WNK5_9PLEO|nr:hypothetical protein P154DRAFT_543874 [Amniculicola lignicola CBS 123094]
MKSVLVVGAGPAGLVAARSLLHSGFQVTVFEAAERVGGMWRVRSGEEGKKCSPEMRTNLSRFTVAFSDLSWESVGLQDGDQSTSTLPMFPKAWQVGRYLETYAKQFIPSSVIVCNTRVSKAELVGKPRRWRVVTVNQTSHETHEQGFDYLVVASGFFDRPSSSFSRLVRGTPTSNIPLQHSSKFRHISSLTSTSGSIVVVVGGGISGSEAAATVATQISSAKHSPGPKLAYAESKVYHVLNRPFYCLPRYIPQNTYRPETQSYNLSPSFLPLDLLLYDLSRRGGGLISASNGQVPPERAAKGHEYIRSVIGGDQRELGYAALVSSPQQTQYPSFTGISDTYPEFVRSGIIVPVRGRATGIGLREVDHTIELNVKGDGLWSLGADSDTTIENVVGIIDATGFEVGLDYLSAQVKQSLEYDAACPRVPFILSRGSVFNPAVPEIAFVGFYEGPYWGVMEMQAQLIAKQWNPSTPEPRLPPALLDTSDSRAIRNALKTHATGVPQFWMMDYVGMVEEFSRSTGVDRLADETFGTSNPLFPARYALPYRSDDTSITLSSVLDTLHASTSSTRFVAAAAFRGMQGLWTLRRKIDSRSSASPGGTLKGTAHFHPRAPTDETFTAEYLYIEEGTFRLDSGFEFPATRRYVYRYSEVEDKISAWFVCEDGVTVERFFNRMDFQEKEKGWIAIGLHWCDPDTYQSRSEFRFRGAAVQSFGITYEVKGPRKDYTMESWYERPEGGVER